MEETYGGNFHLTCGTKSFSFSSVGQNGQATRRIDQFVKIMWHRVPTRSISTEYGVAEENKTKTNELPLPRSISRVGNDWSETLFPRNPAKLIDCPCGYDTG